NILWSFFLNDPQKLSPPNIESFDYNCRSPFVLNSLILCFGDKFGLPNLMHCMRDSFWKSSDKMIEEVKKNPLNKTTPKKSIYLTLMKELLTLGFLGDIDHSFSFTKEAKVAASNPKYLPHPSNIEGIKLKSPKDSTRS
ncbi:MAG: hypothetical protein JSS09_07365, partial [Verrucomicrobia bacterium]|nr:hypothetical protein [Verrucomicrobiota bacterium]